MCGKRVIAQLVVGLVALQYTSPARGEPPPAAAPPASEDGAGNEGRGTTSPPPELPADRDARKSRKLAAANLTLDAQLAEGQVRMSAWDEWDRQVQEVRRRRTNGALLLMGTGLLAGLATATVPFWVDEDAMGGPLLGGLGLSLGLLVTSYVLMPSERR